MKRPAGIWMLTLTGAVFTLAFLAALMRLQRMHGVISDVQAGTGGLPDGVLTGMLLGLVFAGIFTVTAWRQSVLAIPAFLLLICWPAINMYLIRAATGGVHDVYLVLPGPGALLLPFLGLGYLIYLWRKGVLS